MRGHPGRVGAEAAAGDHDGAGAEFVVADGRTDDYPILYEQTVDPPAEGDLHTRLQTGATQDVDHRLPASDRAVHPGQPLVSAEDDLVVELDPQIGDPLHRRARQLGKPLDRRHLHVPLIEQQVVVQQRFSIVLDAGGPLEPSARAHHQTAGQARRSTDDGLRLCHQHARPGCCRSQCRGQTRGPGPDHKDVEIRHGVNSSGNSSRSAGWTRAG